MKSSNTLKFDCIQNSGYILLNVSRLLYFHRVVHRRIVIGHEDFREFNEDNRILKAGRHTRDVNESNITVYKRISCIKQITRLEKFQATLILIKTGTISVHIALNSPLVGGTLFLIRFDYKRDF